MSTVRRYLPSIVLLAWAGLWTVGAQSDAVVIVGLSATSGAVALSIRDSARRGPCRRAEWDR